MQTWKKITIGVLISAASFTALYYGALIALPNVIDLNKYKQTFAETVEKETGFKIDCEDISFKKSLTPYLKIHMYHTAVLYPNGEIFLKLKESDIKIKILPLIFKKIEIKDAKFTRPIINITLYKDFSTSLEKYIDVSKVINTNGFKLDALIYDTVCENYKIKFKDESIGKIFYLEGNELLLKDLKLNDKAHIALNGALFQDEKEYIKYDVDIISALNSDKKQFTFSPFKTIMESDVKADIFGHLKIDKANNIYGNLNIKDLSLKLDDIVSSSNKAELSFKGQEVEIDSVLHTSKTDSAKVKGKFSFADKKNIDLNAKAKNINIHNLVKIVSEISEILNIQNPLNEINAKGLLDADFNISSDFKKLKSSGSAKIINAVIKHKSLPYSITDINAFINFNNNNILIEKANAKVNQTPVNIKGTIDENVQFKLNAFSENLDLNHVINIFDLNKTLPVNVLNGKLSFNSDITGTLNKSYKLNTDIKLNNFSFKDKTYNIPVSVNNLALKIEGDEKKYTGEVLCHNASAKYNYSKFTAPEFKISFDEKKITIPENIISAPYSIKLSGIINNYAKNPSGKIIFSGNILSSAIADLLKQEVKLPYKAVGKIETAGTLELLGEKLNVKAELKADKNNYLSYVVIRELFQKPSILNVDCEIIKNNVLIKDLSLNEYKINSEKMPKIISIAGKVIKDKAVVFDNLKVLIPNSLTISTNFLGGEEISLNANLLLNKTLKSPEIKGNAKIHTYNIKKYLTSVKNADVSFAGNNIRIIAPDVQINDSVFNIIADVIPSLDIKNIVVSNLQLHSMHLDLNSFFSMIEKERNLFANSLVTVKKGTATINKFKILELKANDISSDIQIENNIIKVSNISAKAYTGNVEGDIKYNLPLGKLDINLNGRGIDIKSSLYDLCQLHDNLAGRADFNAKISLSTGNYNEILKSLTGSLKFNAQNGKMGSLGKFEYYLYAQNLLYHGLLNATLNRIADAIVHDNTTQYRQASGSLLFQNGYLITEGIQTVGTNMSLFIKGRHNMLTNQANIDIYGRISDEIKSKLGSFGNVSLSELMNAQQGKREIKVTVILDNTMKNIPDLYNLKSDKTNTFKVNIYGNINSVKAVNSFSWIISDNYKLEQKETLPEFSDIFQNL